MLVRAVLVRALPVLLAATGGIAPHQDPRRPGEGRTVLAALHLVGLADDGDCQGGGCGGRKEEDSRYGSCRNFCPSFDKSPVDHSFNFSPTICVMPGSCTDGKKDGKDGQQKAA